MNIMSTPVALRDPESLQIVLMCMARGAVAMPQRADYDGEYLNACFDLDSVSSMISAYYDSVGIFDPSGKLLELIALDGRRNLFCGEVARVRIKTRL